MVSSSCRDVLWVLVFCGFAVNYMLRTNLNLAIVAMVRPRYHHAAASQCEVVGPTTSGNTSTFNNSTLSVTSNNYQQNSSMSQRFDWSEYEQNLALGAYYWIHWMTQLPGGLLARRYGTKLIFGWGNMATAILGMLIPILAHYHLYGLVGLRVLQGFISGVIWPSMHDMTAKWIPQNERSKFVSSYLGSSVGAAISYPLCAFCIDWFGWEAAFYASALIATIWYCFWYFLVFDSPQQHPRIDEGERNYITENITDFGNDEIRRVDVPWRRLLFSGPLWITIIAHWGGVWGFLTFMTEAPTYFTNVHGWNINTTGLLSGLPHLLRMGFSYIFGYFSDWLLRTKRMSLTNIRKLATFLTTGVQGILTLGLGLSGCAPTLAIFFMMVGTAVNGAVSAGTLANLVDLSPNYASVLLGFTGLVTTSAGFLSPMIVGILTNHNQSIEQWRLVFVIATANLCISGVVYTFWGTSDVQPWNFEENTSVGESPQESQPLKSLSKKKKTVTASSDDEIGTLDPLLKM